LNILAIEKLIPMFRRVICRLGSGAVMYGATAHVCYGPKADSCGAATLPRRRVPPKPKPIARTDCAVMLSKRRKSGRAAGSLCGY
jgi:hypothetical protein